MSRIQKKFCAVCAHDHGFSETPFFSSGYTPALGPESTVLIRDALFSVVEAVLHHSIVKYLVPVVCVHKDECLQCRGLD